MSRHLHMLLRKFTYNWGLKLISVLFAAGLWLMVVNVEDPEMSKTFTVSVDVTNEGYLSSNNMVYEILNSSDTIRVSVTAKRSIISELTNSDLQAIADLSNTNVETGESVQQIPIEVSARRYSSRISLSARNYYLEIETDSKGTKMLEVQTGYKGTPAANAAVGSITAMPSTIEISGAQTILDSISYAEVIVDVSEVSENFNTRLTPNFYDEDGETVDSSKLTLSQSDVTVSVEIHALKTVPVNYQTTGTPEEGYAVDSVTGSVTSITLQGSETSLQDITELNIDDIDVEGISEDTEKSITISKYLPNGVKVASSQPTTTEVKITLKPVSTVEFDMVSTEVVLKGLSSEQTAAVTSETIHFTASGDVSVMENLTSESFSATADLSGYTQAGTYQVPITITGPNNVTPGSATITVTIEGNAVSGEASGETSEIQNEE